MDDEAKELLREIRDAIRESSAQESQMYLYAKKKADRQGCLLWICVLLFIGLIASAIVTGKKPEANAPTPISEKPSESN